MDGEMNNGGKIIMVWRLLSRFFCLSYGEKVDFSKAVRFKFSLNGTMVPDGEVFIFLMMR